MKNLFSTPPPPIALSIWILAIEAQRDVFNSNVNLIEGNLINVTNKSMVWNATAPEITINS